VRKGARGQTMLHTFVFPGSVIYTVTRCCFVVLTALAASGHLAYDGICSVSLLFSYPNLPLRTLATHCVSRGGMTVPLLGCPKNFFTGVRARSWWPCLRDGFIISYLFTAPNNRSAG